MPSSVVLLIAIGYGFWMTCIDKTTRKFSTGLSPAGIHCLRNDGGKGVPRRRRARESLTAPRHDPPTIDSRQRCGTTVVPPSRPLQPAITTTDATDAVLSVPGVVPETLLVQVERLVEQRHPVARLEDLEEVRLCTSVDRQRGEDVHASARPGRGARACRVAAVRWGHGPARCGSQPEIGLGVAVQFEIDDGVLFEE